VVVGLVVVPVVVLVVGDTVAVFAAVLVVEVFSVFASFSGGAEAAFGDLTGFVDTLFAALGAETGFIDFGIDAGFIAFGAFGADAGFIAFGAWAGFIVFGCMVVAGLTAFGACCGLGALP
jgi:hypothetical protein